jgi:hypothetical protein
MKICNLCLKEKEKINFYVNKNSKDGFFKYCKNCHNEKSKSKLILKRTKSINLDLLPNEIFKSTLINENYLVSNLGRAYVKEHFGSRYISGKFLKLTILKTGYPSIQIDRKKYLMHRLIAQVFLKKDINKNFVNHIDSDRTNNKLSNLEWVTFQENVIHGVNKDRYANKLNREQIFIIRNSILSVNELSDFFNVTTTNIRLILNRKIWKHI